MPLHKKGKKSQPGNYRPLSLTSVVCKILEGFIKEAIHDHINNFNLVEDSQHGFVKGSSCTSNFLEDVTANLVKVLPADAVYLDFAKAFDKVSHIRLINKLESHGVNGQVKVWIKTQLEDRRQRALANGKASEWLPVTSGGPVIIYYLH